MERTGGGFALWAVAGYALLTPACGAVSGLALEAASSGGGGCGGICFCGCLDCLALAVVDPRPFVHCFVLSVLCAGEAPVLLAAGVGVAEVDECGAVGADVVGS